MDLKDYESVADASKRLGIVESGVRRFLQQQRLDGIKVGPRKWLVKKDAVPQHRSPGRKKPE
jgi:excisionase family DNA binding protein